MWSKTVLRLSVVIASSCNNFFGLVWINDVISFSQMAYAHIPWRIPRLMSGSLAYKLRTSER